MEIDIETLRTEMKALVQNYKKEKKLRKQFEDRCLLQEEEYPKLIRLQRCKHDFERLAGKSEKSLSHEKEKQKFLEAKLEELLASNTELRQKLEACENEYRLSRQEAEDGKIYIDSLRSNCTEMQEKLYAARHQEFPHCRRRSEPRRTRCTAEEAR